MIVASLLLILYISSKWLKIAAAQKIYFALLNIVMKTKIFLFIKRASIITIIVLWFHFGGSLYQKKKKGPSYEYIAGLSFRVIYSSNFTLCLCRKCFTAS